MSPHDPTIKDVDWQTLAMEYVTGNDSVTAAYLGKKNGISRSTVCGRLTREKWTERRLAHREQVESSRLAKRREYQIEDIKELNIEELRLIDEVILGGEKELTKPKSRVSATELLKACIQKRRIYETIFGDTGDKRQPDTVIDHNVNITTDQDELFAAAAKLFTDAGAGEGEA